MSDFQWLAYGLYGEVFELCFDGLVSSSCFYAYALSLALGVVKS